MVELPCGKVTNSLDITQLDMNNEIGNIIVKYNNEQKIIKEWQQQQVDNWYAHWIHQGFTAIEKQLEKSAGQFCFGNNASVADIFLVAQVYNANRFNVPLDDYPLIVKINDHCLTQKAFIEAMPENQVDCDL